MYLYTYVYLVKIESILYPCNCSNRFHFVDVDDDDNNVDNGNYITFGILGQFVYKYKITTYQLTE